MPVGSGRHSRVFAKRRRHVEHAFVAVMAGEGPTGHIRPVMAPGDHGLGRVTPGLAQQAGTLPDCHGHDDRKND